MMASSGWWSCLGTVDDELTAAHHDWNVTEEHFLFDWLLFLKTQPNAEGLSVSHPQLTTLFRREAWLAQLIAHVAEGKFFVVAFDRKNFLQDTFDAMQFSFFRIAFVLQEVRRISGSDLGKNGATGQVAVL